MEAAMIYESALRRILGGKRWSGTDAVADADVFRRAGNSGDWNKVTNGLGQALVKLRHAAERRPVQDHDGAMRLSQALDSANEALDTVLTMAPDPSISQLFASISSMIAALTQALPLEMAVWLNNARTAQPTTGG